MPTWDILICSIVHRGEKLATLLEELDRQLHSHEPGGGGYRRGVGVLCYRDNLQVPYGLKLAAMTAASKADYVSSVDDDDGIAHDYIARIAEALKQEPDYVGFRVSYTVDGMPSVPVDHSLRHGGWFNSAGMLFRDINQKNPIRREIALVGEWIDSKDPDVHWANGVRASGLCQTEAYVPDPMYFYRYSSSDFFETTRAPAAGWEPMPDYYPWLTMLGEP